MIQSERDQMINECEKKLNDPNIQEQIIAIQGKLSKCPVCDSKLVRCKSELHIFDCGTEVKIIHDGNSLKLDINIAFECHDAMPADGPIFIQQLTKIGELNNAK